MSAFGTTARVSQGFRAIVGTILALGAAFLVVDLSDWYYARFDLSLSGRNTLDEEILDIVDRLPEPVVVDVFFRPLDPPYAAVTSEVFVRMRQVLNVAQNARRNQLEVRYHEANEIENARVRQQELGVEGANIVVFSNASGQKSVRQFIGDIGVIDWGNPQLENLRDLSQQGIVGIVDEARWNPSVFVPARVAAFRGEEVFAESLLKVSSATSPKVYVSTGQGEPSLDVVSPENLSMFRATLEGDGFEVVAWNPLEQPTVPDDCEVLVLAGATQPFPPGTLDAVRAYVSAGGQLLAAPSFEEIERDQDGGIAELLFGYGMLPRPGIVCEPRSTATGETISFGVECTRFMVSQNGLSPSHPLTLPLRNRDRRLYFVGTASLEAGRLPGGGAPNVIVNSSDQSWCDLTIDNDFQYDFEFDYRTEERKRRGLILVAELPASVPDGGGKVTRGRVVGIGGSGFLSDGQHAVNRDFLLNAVNWMAEREHRIRVSPLPTGDSRLDLDRGDALPKLTWSLYLGLPGLAAAVGLVLAFRRRS